MNSSRVFVPTTSVVAVCNKLICSGKKRLRAINRTNPELRYPQKNACHEEARLNSPKRFRFQPDQT